VIWFYRVFIKPVRQSNQRLIKSIWGFLGLSGLFLLNGNPAWANIPGGGTGTGPNVTLTDNGSTVTLANGIISIIITKANAEIHTFNYTFNNTGSSQTVNVLSGGNDGGYLYWFQNGGSFIAGPQQFYVIKVQ
jgi:rhamnogalacturonan endolyase